MSNVEEILKNTETKVFKNVQTGKLEQYEQIKWKYGKLIFVKNQPSQSFIQHISNTHTNNNQNLLLTTYRFQQSNTFPTLYLESNQKNKSFLSVQKITSFLIENNANRNTHLIVKGGGMLMDLGGFTASIYMRGIKNIILIPTTLLGMVDATIGGKTAINYSQTKNMIGTIRNPNQILIYPGYLSTQSQRQFFNGMIQTIKMAITYDKQFFQFLEEVDFKNLRNPSNKNILQKIIKKSLAIKMMVVQKDLTEQHQRKWLNFGHTIGHGIQLDQNNNLLHGECVAIGMVKAIQLTLQKQIITSDNSNMLNRLIKMLKKMNMPVDIPTQISSQRMIKRMLKDKKKSSARSQTIDFVLISEIGKRLDQPTIVSVSQLQKFLSDGIQISYEQGQNIKPINNVFNFPSSKSISLRYLYISCLAYLHEYKKLQKQPIKPQNITLVNFLSSQDTQKMIISLTQLGFKFNLCLKQRKIQIVGYQQNKIGQLDVGNSGITARFILPLCFMVKGEWKINCHKRMQQRPNSQIFKLCSEHFEGNITYLNKQNCFPVLINSHGINKEHKNIIVEGKQSSQFISSAIINWAFISQQKQISFKSQTQTQKENSQIVSQSYLHMTNKCLQNFGIRSILDKHSKTIKINSRNMIVPRQIAIQNDLSTYSYPYIFYELHDFENNKINPQKFMQGDVLFYQQVQQLKSKLNSGQKVLKFNFNNCTDTFMTFCIFCCSDKLLNSNIKRIIIENISNQRVKQSNRIDLTIKNLKKIGVSVQEYQNHIQIVLKPINKSLFQLKDLIIFQTHQDHRLAMSFGILSSFLCKKFHNTKFIIYSKKAVQKTFPEFWKYLQQSGVKLNYISVQQYMQKSLNISQNTQKDVYKKFIINQNIVKNSIFIVGNRGSGKTTIGRHIASKMGLSFIDIDDIITTQIRQNYRLQSIEQMVNRIGWSQFRNLESKVLQNTLSTLRYSSSGPYVISTGGGILQRQLNRTTFKRQKLNTFYIERSFDQLKANVSSNRPSIQNFKQISQQRQSVYENHSSQIVTFPQWLSPQKQRDFTIDSIQKSLSQQKIIPEGYILCLGDEILDTKSNLTSEEINEVDTFEIRIDKLLFKGLSMRNVRQQISKFRIKHPQKNIILTLRTKQQLGQFQSNQKNYEKQMNKISQIPCDFLDFQITKKVTFPYNFNKLIWSYHGNDQSNIKKIIGKNNGFKKFCFINSNKNYEQFNLYQKYKQKFSHGICLDLSNPLSRLRTKYQMIIPQKSLTSSSLTGIMSLNQMKGLKKLLRIK